MKVKIYKNPFLVLISIFIIVQIVSESNLTSFKLVDSILYIIRFGLLGMYTIYIFMKSKFKKDNFLIVLLGSALVVINMFFFSGGNSLFFVILIAIAYIQSEVPFKQVLYSIIVITVITEIVIISMSLLGVISNDNYSRELSIYTGSFFAGEHNRYTFGFINLNQIPLTFFDILILYICYKKNELKNFTYIVLMIINYIIYYNTNSRVVFILSTFIIIFSFIFKRVDLKRTYYKKTGGMIWITVPIATILSFVTAIFYDSSNWTMAVANEILSNRLKWSQQMLLYYGKDTFSLFGYGDTAGTAIDNLGYIVDNGYIKMFIQRGVLISTILIIVWSRLIYIAQKKRQVYLLICLVAVVIANIINDQFLSYRLIPFYCIFLEDLIVDHRRKVNGSYNNS